MAERHAAGAIAVDGDAATWDDAGIADLVDLITRNAK